jgi:hypothetical protein
MPTSSPAGKDFIKSWINRQPDIRTILDVGAGEGTYSHLLGRNYKLIAVEVFQPYIDQFNLHDKYDQVILGDIRTLTLPHADCVIFGDVLEHMTEDDARKLINLPYPHMVVSLPLGHWPQGAVNGNDYETHVTEWSAPKAEDFFAHFPIRRTQDGMGIYIK